MTSRDFVVPSNEAPARPQECQGAVARRFRGRLAPLLRLGLVLLISCGPYEERSDRQDCTLPGAYSKGTCPTAADFLRQRIALGCLGRDDRCVFENARGPLVLPTIDSSEDGCCYVYTYVDKDSSE